MCGDCKHDKKLNQSRLYNKQSHLKPNSIIQLHHSMVSTVCYQDAVCYQEAKLL